MRRRGLPRSRLESHSASGQGVGGPQVQGLRWHRSAEEAPSGATPYALTPVTADTATGDQKKGSPPAVGFTEELVSPGAGRASSLAPDVSESRCKEFTS